jgi:glyoxylase-like metal-dependent hydrolase (beta-lactamase superfamily II)
VKELRSGLWTWSAPHPDWTPESGGPEGWEQEVRSYALDAGDSLVLFDPLVEPEPVARLARGRPVAIVVTCHWHMRSSEELQRALDAVVHVPATEARDLGLTVVNYVSGDQLPGDVEPQSGGYADECVLWIPAHRALVIGDVFLGGERGFRVQPDSWLDEGLTREELRERLLPLLELPVELLLPTHGDPVADGAADTLRSALVS